jgi:hypothetical protein
MMIKEGNPLRVHLKKPHHACMNQVFGAGRAYQNPRAVQPTRANGRQGTHISSPTTVKKEKSPNIFFQSTQFLKSSDL